MLFDVEDSKIIDPIPKLLFLTPRGICEICNMPYRCIVITYRLRTCVGTSVYLSVYFCGFIYVHTTDVTPSVKICKRGYLVELQNAVQR